LGIFADGRRWILHGALDLGTGDTWINKDNEPNHGDERANTGLIAHQRLRILALLSLPSSRTGLIVTPGRSDSCPVLDFIFLGPELFDFELELYRMASVTF
jgi:hypothetical protein